MKILLLGVQLTSLVHFRGPLIRDLVAAGHQVVAVAPEPSAHYRSVLHHLGASYIEAPLARTGINPAHDFHLLFWLWKMLRREKPDVLLAFQAKAVIYGIPAGWLAGVARRLAMIEGLGQGFISQPGAGLRRRLVQLVMPALYRLSLLFAQRVIFLNADDEAEFLQRRLVRPSQTARIPGIGVDLVHYARSCLPAPPFMFLMIGRLIVDKGVREFVEAARIVRQQLPAESARFALLGGVDTSHVGISPDAVRASGVVDYHGEVTDVRPWLQACHCFVLPSYREGLPRAAMEAMATGRPLITTDVPGARETVVAGRNGYLVEPRNPEALAAAMISMINLTPSEREGMGQASRQLAEQRFDVIGINQQLMLLMGLS